MSFDGSPRAAEKKRSMAAARANGFRPFTTAGLKPSGRATSGPMRMTCASLERSEPLGCSRSSVSSVTAGSSSPSESSIGAPIGGPASTDAAMPETQSSWSTSTTAVGRSVSPVAGNSAFATPAASAAASPPPTLIVLRVALEGKPSFSVACSSSAVTATCGGVDSSSPRVQPARASTSTRTSASERRKAGLTIARSAAETARIAYD